MSGTLEEWKHRALAAERALADISQLCGMYKTERDRYRAALERIEATKEDWTKPGWQAFAELQGIAMEALGDD